MQPPSRQARRTRLPLALVALAACAHPEPPPGGPPDFDPPVVLSITPDSGSILPPDFDDDIEIQFNEIVAEVAGSSRPGTTPGAGGRSFGGPVAGGRGRSSGLSSYVLLSPVDGDVRVGWRRSRITIKPRDGWEPNRVYRLELLPGIQDLRQNALERGRVVYLSTGPALEDTYVSGVALDWAARTFYRNALISVRPSGDSVGYLIQTDSTGNFALPLAPPGDYVVYGIADQNNNRRLDTREASDSAAATLVVGDTATVELWMFPRDTNPPRSITAQPVDSFAARVQTTHLLDPYQPLDSGMVRILMLPDSAPQPVAGLWRTEVYDSILAARQPEPEPDSLAADSAAVDSAEAPAAPPEEAPVEPEAAIFGTRPPISDVVVVESRFPWAPDTRYVIEILGLRSAAGYSADTLRVIFDAPAPREPAPTDSLEARSDSAAVPPPDSGR